MARRFSNIPPVGTGNERQVLSGLVDAVSYITAQAQDKILPLTPTTATTADVANKINEIISRLQGT